MGLTKPNQELRRNLKKVSFHLEQTAIDVLKLASRANAEDALTILHMLNRLYEDADWLATYADEVKVGRIVRERAE
jgi:hypothetical protein